MDLRREGHWRGDLSELWGGVSVVVGCCRGRGDGMGQDSNALFEFEKRSMFKLKWGVEGQLPPQNGHLYISYIPCVTCNLW